MSRSAPIIFLLSVGAMAAPGNVIGSTARTAYLDAGARDGLAAGARIDLRRAGRPAGACKVESVADHYASCAADGAQAGDTFVAPRQPPSPPSATWLRPAPADQIRREGQALERAALPLVEFTGTAVAHRPQLDARVTHLHWATRQDKPWSQERLDARMRGAPIGAGLSLDADLSARWYSMRAGPVSARPEDRMQLYVWTAALRRDLPGAAFAVGRVRPSFAPGATPIDGAQVGYRAQGGNEVGIYGGALPDPVTLAPTTSSGTAGAYWRLQAGHDLWFRHEARVALVSTEASGKRVQAEGLAQLAAGPAVDVAAEVRGSSDEHGDSAALDAARVDLFARPVSQLSMSASFRYLGMQLPERDGPGTPGLGGASRHGDAAVSWELSDAFIVSAHAGGHQDLTTAVSRGFAGPELAMPRLFGNAGGVSAGFQEERGFDSGRSAWLQASLAAPSWLRLSATGSWWSTRDGSLHSDEVGISLMALARLSRLIQLRATLLTRGGGVTGSWSDPWAAGLSGSAQLEGAF